ncbi:MAG: FAD:protein FMN transferase [Steroidobacteraceae bacterium]
MLAPHNAATRQAPRARPPSLRPARRSICREVGYFRNIMKSLASIAQPHGIALDSHLQMGQVRIDRLRPALGTLVALSIDAPDEVVAQRGLEAAWEAIRRVEALMHPARAGSDLARLNAAGAGEAVAIDPWTAALLRTVAALHVESRGAFDPCLPQGGGRFDDLQWRAEAMLLPRVPLRLDLGGIAKGYAVDRAIEALAATGCGAALVNAGGDLRVWGARAEEIEVGRAGGPRLRLADAALAVSAPSAQAPPEHQGFYCRVPGRRRMAHAAAIVAPTATLADALTKCALYMEEAECAALLARHGARRVQLSDAPAQRRARRRVRAGARGRGRGRDRARASRSARSSPSPNRRARSVPSSRSARGASLRR